MFSSTLRRISVRPIVSSIRSISTLQSNPHIYVFPNPTSPSTHILTLLPTSPPSPNLSIGTTSKLPPTPDTFTENPRFLPILDSVLSQYAASDPGIQSQASAFASTSGSALGSGGMFFPDQKRKSGRGGWVHVSDSRLPPDYGRIAWPEDIFGSLEVDGQGGFVRGGDGTVGNWQRSGTYRVLTREGVLGLSDYLRGKLVERLREEEQREKSA